MLAVWHRIQIHIQYGELKTKVSAISPLSPFPNPLSAPILLREVTPVVYSEVHLCQANTLGLGAITFVAQSQTGKLLERSREGSGASVGGAFTLLS